MKLTITQALQQAVAAHKEGKLQKAKHLYRAILQSQPTNSDANYNLGVLAISVNKADAALPLFKTALETNPNIEQFWLAYIEALIENKKLEDAKQLFEQGKKQGKLSGTDAYLIDAAIKENVGRLDEAKAIYKQVIALNPGNFHFYSKLSKSLIGLGKLTEAETRYRQAITLKPDVTETHYNLGITLQKLGRLYEAEVSYTQAVALAPNFAEAHSNLGVTLQALGRLDEAEASHNQAIAAKPDYAGAHNNLGSTLYELGRFTEAEANLNQAIALEPNLVQAHSSMGLNLIALGMRESALKHFQIRLGLERGPNPLNPRHKSFISISKAKIDHDIEQFKYLADLGHNAAKFHDLATIYSTVASEIDFVSDTEIIPLGDKYRVLLGDTYNRPVHIIEAPLLEEPAINKNLNAKRIADDYFSHEFGLTYIDEFLSPKALASLFHFLLGSTIWFDFFHRGGYLGAYLTDGLASPLILQISEELRLKLPDIFKHHKLTQLWAYKYDSRAKNKASFNGISAHADFAAINVNFWITPNSANLNKFSGGLIVYNSEAPQQWDFKTYNSDEKKILEEISKHKVERTIIPYNENRAVIFNSNLFHETDRIDFKDGYENRRINVTMLFGKREL